ncbi:sugar transferase [Streptococcus pluranimalium]|uniref:sugar transferase n=1 Tax=Streptococcus pluranimalium TaxID=82348 RepID=UPI003F666940
MYIFFKRIIDIFVSLLGLIILFPLFVLVSFLIKVDSRGTVLFRQKRIGLNGKVFDIYKFRSMTMGAEKVGSGQYSYAGDPRVTKIGKIIRATSIDELPQFLNILKGEMSLIGPRPVLTYHPKSIDEYSENEKIRFKVRPGVTGWAQIHGRKTVDWSRRFELDRYYVENLSFLLDIKIFFMTIRNVVLMKDNVNTKETK